ncbi:MAG: AAA family ATPase [Pseudonocardiaceae bacterium]
MNLSSILSVLDDLHSVKGGYKALCPAHEDNVPSLSVSKGNNQEVLLHCHAGCEYDEIRRALVRRMQTDLACSYLYRNAEGDVIGEVVRSYDGDGRKRFFQKVRVGEKWRNGSSDELKGIPYNLPAVLDAVTRGKKVFIVEGEKDADRLAEEGHIATCNVGGVAMGWKDEHSGWLNGCRRVYVIADDDDPGRKHAWRTYDSIVRIGGVGKVSVHYSALGKDISDHLDQDGQLRELRELERDVVEEIGVSTFVSGASFVFDTPAEVPAIWGLNGKEILWAEGQGLTIVAPQGVGKTSLASLLVEGLLGLSESVLGFPIRQCEGLAYLAMDRPYQIASAMRRVFEPHGREILETKRFQVWAGPPEDDFGRYPEALPEMIEEAGCNFVIVDTLKDAVLRLTDEAAAQGWNSAVQHCLKKGIQVCVLHHPTKHTGRDADKPIDLSDVYGSNWITAGMGSVLSMWGTVGSRFFELTQLKSPAMVLDPLIISRNDRTGEMQVVGGGLDWTWYFTEPHSIADLCKYMFGPEAGKSNMEKARRQVQDLLDRAIIIKHAESKSPAGGRPTTLYILRSPEA